MKSKNRPLYKLGLTLSGGGARGFAHLGALQALEERSIRPDILSGTSVGSLVSVLYADGHSIEDMLRIASAISFFTIAESGIPRGGFLKSSGISSLLKKHLRAKTFEELKLPVRVVASDIEKGESRVFSEGEIIPAVVASCSVPIVFMPVEIDKHHYVDGGMTNNFPVSAIRKDCERVIGVNISPVIPSEYDDSIRYVIERAMNCMVGSNTVREREQCDYLIESHGVSKYSLFDFKHAAEIYVKGYKSAKSYLDKNIETIQKDLVNIQKPFIDRIGDFLGIN